jgi:hypothetical protein
MRNVCSILVRKAGRTWEGGVNGYETNFLRNKIRCRCGHGSSEYGNEALVLKDGKFLN